MGKPTLLRNRLGADLTDNLLVTPSAIGLAVAASVLVSLDRNPLPVSIDSGARFLPPPGQMDLAFAYDDYWPVGTGQYTRSDGRFCSGYSPPVSSSVSTNSPYRKPGARLRVSGRSW